ncbi:molybdenum cofactor guanylyltransferase MobA [Parahalioglobus pacificus]|uniref:Molybdenum cofactor guanylyltransferase n=1 Tax=Parahalioglobus pacificus TaxID=930806 RepID=A0A919CJH2_9GAMM|nr:molybdenum cofactor guanylyltransferase MobA [Halioglobus pacificus]GHD28428.1 molybdenum cofactor guanylyltransferase [Halioglobus pacificus]
MERTEFGQHRTDITGLILAGGRGSRMGGVDKGLVDIDGRPLIAATIERLRPQASTIVISCNRNAEHYRPYADRLVTDLRADFQGPLAGIEALGEINTPLLLVTPCDTPNIPSNLGARLLAAMTPATDAVYAQSDGRQHYLCLLLRQRALPTLSPYLDSGQRSVRHWLQTLNTEAVSFANEAHAFTNVNYR